MDDESLKKLKAKREYLEEWLANHKAADEVAAEVQKNLDFTNWQIDALETTPPEAEEIPWPDITKTLDSDTSYLVQVLPPMPFYQKNMVVSASAFTSSGTVSVFQYASRIRDIGTEASVKYSSRVTVAFQDLQRKYDRPSEVRNLLAQLGNAGTVDRFDTAVRSFDAYKRGTASRTAPAIDIRTLIDGVKGDLYVRARTQPKENMDWTTMAKRLALGGQQYSELVDSEKKHSSLVSRLSDIAKDREGGAITDINNVWVETQDYLVSLLRLVLL